MEQDGDNDEDTKYQDLNAKTDDDDSFAQF